MATVTPEERRMLMDFFGVDSAQIDAMSDEKAMRGLVQYHESGKLAEYEVTPVPAAVDWITDGLLQSASPAGIEFGFRETGKAIATTARQVGPAIQAGLASASSTIKMVALAVVVIGVGLAYVKLK